MIYGINGTAISSAYSLDSAIPKAYALNGTQVFPDGNLPLKVMSYNVGSWTAFGGKATASNQEFWYALQNGIFNTERPDLCGIQEYYSAIGSYSVPTMLSQYFTSQYEVDWVSTKAGRGLCANYTMTNAHEVNFQNQNGEIRSYLIADVTINGKTVKFLTAHLALDNATIIEQIQELLSAVANFDYWILTGDFNIAFPNAQSDGYTYLVKPFLDAGYHVANGSDFGFINTFSTKAPGDDSDWRVLDNIMCSANIDITDVYVDETKLEMLTTQGIDHLPLIAEMELT